MVEHDEEGACVVLINESIELDWGIEVVPKGASSIKAMGIMDTWKRGRIIYAYLIWVVFKATTAGGLYGEYTFTNDSNGNVQRNPVIPRHTSEPSFADKWLCNAVLVKTSIKLRHETMIVKMKVSTRERRGKKRDDGKRQRWEMLGNS